jgi:preprotein translocase subunit Sec63
MADYHYDEAGNMAAYFLITFLAIILVPLTFSLSLGSSMFSLDVGIYAPHRLNTKMSSKAAYKRLPMPTLY